MITQDQVREVIGSTAYDSSGSKLGKVGQVYLDGRSGNPKWITAQTGMFGTKESFVPVDDASYENGQLTLAYSKDTVKEAPSIESDGELAAQDESELYRYYNMDRAQGSAGMGAESGQERSATGQHEQSGAASQQGTSAGDARTGRAGDEAMTRSEEELRVGTEQRETGRARLRKYVVTEEEQVTVPVSHEEVRVEREPVTEDNRGQALEGSAISEDEHEVTLHEERPVVSKEAHPVERVRMEKETVRDEETVRDDVRKERIQAEGTEGNEDSGGREGQDGRHRAGSE